MPGVQTTDKATVMLRAAALLRARMAPLSNIRVVAEDEVPADRPHVCLTVSMHGGNFDYANQAGGSKDVVTYQGTLRVSIWAINRTDRTGSDVNALTSDDTGLFRIERNILKAMIGSALQETEAGGDGVTPLLTQQIYAVSDTSAQRSDLESTGTKGHHPNARATMAIDFGVDFAWDLS